MSASINLQGMLPIMAVTPGTEAEAEEARARWRQQEADASDDNDEEGEDEENGAVRPVIRDVCEEPTDKEMEEHYMNHSESRQWCPHCVKGKAVSYGSRRRQEEIEE